MIRQQWIGTVVSVLFFIWLLPLGIFIKPSQEKIACDGQRAICLCHTKMMSQAKVDTQGKLMLTQNTGHNKEAASHGGGNNLYLTYLPLNHIDQGLLRYLDLAKNIPSLLLINPIEHVPKF